MELLNQVMGGGNVQVPVGYVYALAVLVVLWSGWKAVTFAYRTAVAILSNLSFAGLGSALLVITGLGGSGYSIGELASGPVEPKNNYVLSNEDLHKLAENKNSSQVSEVLRYAEKRHQLDSNLYYCVMEDSQQQEIKVADYRTSSSLLAASIGFLLCGVVWFFRSV